MIKLGLVKGDGVWNNPSVYVYNNSYNGMKPEKEDNIFGLITIKDRFVLLSEDDDHYFNSFNMNEDELNELKSCIMYSLKDSEKFKITETGEDKQIINIEFNGNKIQFHNHWTKSLKNVLDLDGFVPNENAKYIGEDLKFIDYDKVDIMTPEEVLIYNIVKYNCSYFYRDTDITKFRIYDQLFNTIGNGYTTDLDIRTQLNKKKITKKIKDNYLLLYTEPLFRGYTKVEKYEVSNKTFTVPDSRSEINGLYREQDKITKPKVVYWKEVKANDEMFSTRKKGYYEPYPNFQEKYSLLYRTNVFQQYPRWMSEAHWYYSKCLENVTDETYIEFIKKTLTKIENGWN